MILTEPITKFEPSIGFSQGGSGQVGSTVWQAEKYEMGFAAPHAFQRLSMPEDMPTDPDIFLGAIDNKSLHSVIREAVEQCLESFRRGLYMPATVMLAAAAEATWSECGIAVAAELADNKLQAQIGDQYTSISEKVAGLCKALEQPSAKPLLKSVGLTSAKLNDAHVWTTVLRDRRSALHWSKAKSFLADHSETATLLIAAPLHIATLETLRLNC